VTENRKGTSFDWDFPGSPRLMCVCRWSWDHDWNSLWRYRGSSAVKLNLGTSGILRITEVDRRRAPLELGSFAASLVLLLFQLKETLCMRNGNGNGEGGLVDPISHNLNECIGEGELSRRGCSGFETTGSDGFHDPKLRRGS